MCAFLKAARRLDAARRGQQTWRRVSRKKRRRRICLCRRSCLYVLNSQAICTQLLKARLDVSLSAGRAQLTSFFDAPINRPRASSRKARRVSKEALDAKDKCCIRLGSQAAAASMVRWEPRPGL